MVREEKEMEVKRQKETESVYSFEKGFWCNIWLQGMFLFDDIHQSHSLLIRICLKT